MNKELEREIKRAQREKLEKTLAFHIQAAGLPAPEEQVKLIDGRQWRYDFFWREARLIVEVEGGVYSGGRHVRGKGFEEDMDKYNSASILGYTVLRYSGGMVEDGRALHGIQAALGRLGQCR